MALDRFGTEELITGVDPDTIRFAWQDRLPHDPDARIYLGAGRLSPASGTPLIGYLRRLRDFDDGPEMNLPEWWDLSV